MGKSVDPELHQFAEALRNGRELTGMSQAEMAKLLGVAQASYSTWENAQIEPSRMRVRQIEQLLGFPPGGLSQHLSPPYFPAETVRGPVRGRKQLPRVEDVIRLDAGLDTRDREVLLATYKAMTAKGRGKVAARGRPSSGCITADDSLVAA